MKKSFLVLVLLASISQSKDIEVNTLKWTSDFETLVNLSGNVENTIKGLDQNGNQVRDDVEYYLKSRYSDKPFRKAIFLKAAKKMQKIMTLPVEADLKVRQKLDHDLLNLYTCMDYMLYKTNSKIIEKEMQEKVLFKAKVLNTEKRLRAYIKHKKLLPFSYDELSDKELEEDKHACIKEYNKYKNQDQNLLTSTK